MRHTIQRWGGVLVVLLGLLLVFPASAFAWGSTNFGVFVGPGFHHPHHFGHHGFGHPFVHPGFIHPHPRFFGSQIVIVNPPVVIVDQPVVTPIWVPGQWFWTGSTWAWVPAHWQ